MPTKISPQPPREISAEILPVEAGLIDSLPPAADRSIESCDGESGVIASRRSFLKSAAFLGMAAMCPRRMLANGIAPAELASAATSDEKFIREARFYDKQPHKKIQCRLCPRECVIDDRERGYCGARENRGGTYYTLVHSRACTYHADPIEKKPFFHFYPGTQAFSISTAGCNVNCKFCQNWEISQSRPEQIRSIYLPPKEVAAMARQYRCDSIAYTYGEPVIFYEYMADTAAAGRETGVKSVVVTGGYIATDPLVQLCSVVDAIKVDLKAYSEKYYQEVVNGKLKPVLEALVTMRKQGMWTEIVYLVVPTLNDSDEEFTGLARWIKAELGVDVPVHFTRFHPQYLLKNLPPTPIKTLERAKAIADAEGLHFVYVGNVPGHPAENTYCPYCQRLLVQRTGFFVREVHIKHGKCRYCEKDIAGVWGR